MLVEANKGNKKQGFRFEKVGRNYQINFGGAEINIPEENGWQLGIPVAVLLGLAAIIGECVQLLPNTLGHLLHTVHV